MPEQPRANVCHLDPVLVDYRAMVTPPDPTSIEPKKPAEVPKPNSASSVDMAAAHNNRSNNVAERSEIGLLGVQGRRYERYDLSNPAPKLSIVVH